MAFLLLFAPRPKHTPLPGGEDDEKEFPFFVLEGWSIQVCFADILYLIFDISKGIKLNEASGLPWMAATSMLRGWLTTKAREAAGVLRKTSP